MIKKALEINSFSVIIPLYNKVEYIERAINSILAQTYQNFEVIIVNDGSTDGSINKLKLFQDDRVKLINQPNQGVSVARNNGAKKASFNFLAFLDADDIWHETFLEVLNLLINKYPHAGIYGTNNFFEYPNGKVFFEEFNWLFGGEKTGIIKDYFALFAKIGKSPFSNSNLCIPSKIYHEFGGYKEGVKLTEDSDLWCRIALNYEVAYSTTPLSIYYLGLQGSSHMSFESKDYEVFLTLKNALKEKIVKQKQIRSVKKLMAFQRLSLIKRSLLTGNKLFVLEKIIYTDLIYFYPLSLLQCLVVIFIPHNIFNYFRRKKYY